MLEELPGFILKPLAALTNGWPWLGGKFNAYAVNRLVNACRHRPHPWSTVHDYVSWTSLTDQRWSARHLPAARIPNLPSVEQVVGLFKRPTGQQRLSAKSTLLFPAFAQYLTDGFIRTRMPNASAGEPEELRRQNTSNHQIDLCTLYGRTPEQTHALRLNSGTLGERGRLKSQTVNAETYSPFLYDNDAVKVEFECLDAPLGIDRVTDPRGRALIFATGGDRVNASPQVAMVNMLLLREHNRLAGVMERLNTNWDDERVFQTARNTMIVLFIKIVVEEYINHISSVPLRFRADPSVAWDAPWNKPNWITTEFSLLYRWHSLIPDTITWNNRSYPVQFTFMNNSLLLDGGLAGAFLDMSSQAAAQLGPFNTADALLDFEKRAIEQGRLCNLATYADYRAYLNLPRPADFGKISKDLRVVEFLKKSYNSVADIEFYVGLFAEDTLENSPLPPLILSMVAVDAFSQALTNPLLSRHVFNAATFSEAGWEAINSTASLRDLLVRNSPPGSVGDKRIDMTQEGWKFR